MIGREAEITRLKDLLYDVPLVGATFVALTGEKGIGKSTILKHFVQSLPDWADGILVRFSGSRRDFFMQFVRCLNLSETAPSRISVKLHNFLEKRKTPFVLAIDDADLSSGFLLDFLESLKTYQVLLVLAVGSGSVPSYFEVIRIRPWTIEDMREFYRQSKGTSPSVATIVEMEEVTGGNPGKCQDFLTGGLKNLQEVSEDVDDGDPERLKRRAYELQARGRFEEALKVFERLLDTVESPEERERLKLSIIANWSLTPEETMRVLNTIEKDLLEGEDAYQFELLRAYVYSHRLEFERAIDVLNEFLEGVRSGVWYANALALRGETRYHLGDIRGAELDFREVIRTWRVDDEISFMAYRGLALIEMYRLNYARAMASIRRMDAIALALQNFSLIQIARTLKASLLAKTGKLKEAEWILYETVKLSRNAGINYSYPLFYSLSIPMIKLDFKSAIHTMKYILESGVHGITREFLVSLIHLDLARAYLEIGEPELASEHIRKFKSMMPRRHAWIRVVENLERRLKVERGEKVSLKVSRSLNAEEVEKRIIKYMVLAMEGKKPSARRGFVSLVKRLERKNAYDWLMKTAHIARRFFPHDPEFTRFFSEPEKRKEKFGLFLLGPYRIVDFSTELQVFNDTLKSVKLREFISLLGLSSIISRDGRLSRFFIKEKLWPFFGEERQNKNLSWVISRFREIFGREGIVKEGDFYRLNTELIYLDILEFLRFYRLARDAEKRGKDFLAFDNFRAAVDLVFGRPFEGLPVESCEDSYQALMGMIEHSFERICEMCLVIGKTREARELSEFARNIFPFNEKFYRYPVRSYLVEGRRLRARKELQTMKRIYENEFGEPFKMEIH